MESPTKIVYSWLYIIIIVVPDQDNLLFLLAVTVVAGEEDMHIDQDLGAKKCPFFLL